MEGEGERGGGRREEAENCRPLLGGMAFLSVRVGWRTVGRKIPVVRGSSRLNGGGVGGGGGQKETVPLKDDLVVPLLVQVSC